jgi:peptide deformylase
MPLRPILLSDDPLLREKSRRVRRVRPELQELIDDMIETMHAGNGIGLAAVQVGVPERVIVVQVPKEPDEDAEEDQEPQPGELYVVINPELARVSRKTEEGLEGCLSVPGWVGMVSRHCDVTVKGMDRHGKYVRIKADGFLARVFRHEIDHCHGILFIDHIEDPEKIWPVEEGEEEAIEAAAHLRKASPE